MTSRRAPARRPCSPASPGVRWPRTPCARAAAASPRSAAGRCRGRTRTARRSGAQSAPKVKRPPPAAQLDRVGRDEVRHALEARPSSGPTLERVGRGRTRAASNAFSIRSSLPQAPTTRRNVSRAPGGACSAAAPVRGAGPAVDRHRLLARRVGQRVRVRHEVEEVVRVQVGDEHRVDVDVVDDLAQLGEHAVAAVEQQAVALLLDEVSGAGAVGVLPGGRLAQDRDLHCGGTLSAPGGSRVQRRLLLRASAAPTRPAGGAPGGTRSAAAAAGAGPPDGSGGTSGTARRNRARRGGCCLKKQSSQLTFFAPCFPDTVASPFTGWSQPRRSKADGQAARNGGTRKSHASRGLPAKRRETNPIRPGCGTPTPLAPQRFLPSVEMRTLVTGVSGYVGGALAGRLREDGHEVRGFARTPARVTAGGRRAGHRRRRRPARGWRRRSTGSTSPTT